MESTRDQLKNKFKKGDKPTEVDYADVIDSFLNKQEDEYYASNSLPQASTTTKGIVEAATLTEVDAGTDKERYVTPEGVKRAVGRFAPEAPVASVNGTTGAVVIPNYEDDDTGWSNVTLLTGISRIGTATPRVRKKVGIVFMEGEIKIDSSTTGNTTLFTLPANHRPSRNLILYTTGSHNQMVRIQISTAGAVTTNNVNSSTGIVNISISGISFLA